jgi:3-isopropylmalate/(R)-2-methylmalate dehydratase small subunit
MNTDTPEPTVIAGRVWRYGDDVNTDVIFPGKYTYTLREPADIAAHALEDLDPQFTAKAQPGDIIVAGRNWGHGSSREQAVTTLKYRGIAAVVVQSVGRIYYRNALNQGLLLVTCPEAVAAAHMGDWLEVDLTQSCVRVNGQTFEFPPLSPSLKGMVAAGGLVPHLRRKLGLTGTAEVKVSE